MSGVVGARLLKQQPTNNGMGTTAGGGGGGEFASPPPVHQRSSSSSSPQVLPGRYKEFFTSAYHAHVSAWYHTSATKHQREKFKHFVKKITDFDFETTSRQRLRVGFGPDVVAAHAIVNSNGRQMLTPSAQEKAAQYLAFASLAERQAYRESIGLIVPPSLTVLHRSKASMDFSEDTKHMKGELMLRDASTPILAKTAVKKNSDATTAKCEVVGDGKSQYGMFYAWKVAPKAGVNVTQRAHDASFQGSAPWGEYAGSSHQKGQWVSHAQEDAAARGYDVPVAPEGPASIGSAFLARPASVGSARRRYQNFNENIAHDTYRAQRIQKRQAKEAAKLQRERNEAEGTTAPLSSPAGGPNSDTKTTPMMAVHPTISDAELFRPERAPRYCPAKPGMVKEVSPIFCR